MGALPKPIKRIRDHEAVMRKVAGAQCRVCGKAASDGHHIVLRSQGGDDVEENILPLCHEDHMRYHAGKGRLKLRPEEFQYVVGKLGRQPALEYLKKRRISR